MIHGNVIRSFTPLKQTLARTIPVSLGIFKHSHLFYNTYQNFTTSTSPWESPMCDEDFDLMQRIISAPSPVNLEAAMTMGVLAPWFDTFVPDTWKLHTFRGNSGVILDTHPGRSDMLTVMICGHADKIRMQVRSISKDGKIYVNCDSFLPATLIGNPIKLFCDDPSKPGEYCCIKGTVEALGAIHFAAPGVMQGKTGIKAEQIYIELGLHGKKRNDQVENLGIKPGDSVILDRPIQRCVAPDTFSGAYLDNGLGCFVAASLAKLVANMETPIKNIRTLFAFAAHEEIGRFGSRVLVAQLEPDVLIAVDVNHDYANAPGVANKRLTPLELGKGPTIAQGAITSKTLNDIIEKASKKQGIIFQRDMVGRDTGTDAMAAVLGSVDAAATSIGFPIRNMHTISELAHTGDVLQAIHGIHATLNFMDHFDNGVGMTAEHFKKQHQRLDHANPITTVPSDIHSE